MSATAMERQQHNQLIQQHIEKLKARYAADDMSILELKLRHQELAEDMNNKDEYSDSARELFKVEAELVAGIIHEETPPMPTPEETLETLKQTNPVAAEALQHQMNMEALEQSVVAAQASFNEAIEQGWASDSAGYRQREEALTSAKQALNEALLTPPPKFARDAEHKALTKSAADLRVAADNLGEQSADSSLARTQDALLGEAQEMEDQAAAVRSHIPVFDTPAA